MGPVALDATKSRQSENSMWCFLPYLDLNTRGRILSPLYTVVHDVDHVCRIVVSRRHVRKEKKSAPTNRVAGKENILQND